MSEIKEKPTSFELGTMTVKTDGVYLTETGEKLEAVAVYNRLRMYADEILMPEVIEEVVEETTTLEENTTEEPAKNEETEAKATTAGTSKGK